jgi:hypothetical protein
MATKETKSVFHTLNAIDCSGHIEQKSNGRVTLSYLSWAWAWAEVKKNYPDAVYTIYENADGWNYHTDGRTCWVKTGVTINGLEHIEYLPVMDNRNQSIPLDKVTSFNVNTTIQRSLTKAAARHGLGLYIYAGEDLPEDVKNEREQQEKKAEDEALVVALKQIEAAVSRAELNEIWRKYSGLQKNQTFFDAIKNRGMEIAA